MPTQGKPHAETLNQAAPVQADSSAANVGVGPSYRIMSLEAAKEYVRAYSEASGGAKTAIGALPIFALALGRLKNGSTAYGMAHKTLRDAALATTGSTDQTTWRSLAIDIAAALSITLP